MAGGRQVDDGKPRWVGATPTSDRSDAVIVGAAMGHAVGHGDGAALSVSRPAAEVKRLRCAHNLNQGQGISGV